MNLTAGLSAQGTSKVKRNSDGAILTDIAMSNWTIKGNSDTSLCSFEFDASSNSSVVKLNATPVKAGSGVLDAEVDIIYEDESGNQQTLTAVKVQGAYMVAPAAGSLGVTISFEF